MSFHNALPLGELHAVQNWSVANAAARAALVLVAADIGKVCRQTDTGHFYILTNNVGAIWYDMTAAGAQYVCEMVAASDETTALTAGTSKITFDFPYAFSLTQVAAGLTTPQVGGGLVTVDVKKNATSIFTTKITIDNTEANTNTAAAASVLTSTPIVVSAWDRFTVNIDSLGDGTAKGLKLYFIGTKP